MTASGRVPCTANQIMVARLETKGYVSSIPFLLRATGHLRVDILRDALQLIVDRHAILRSAFALCGEALTQSPIDGVGVALPVTDVSAASDPLAAALAEVAADGQCPFELSALPRLRGRLFRLAEEDHVVSVIVDHLAADGISLGILAAEWRSLYQTLAAGTPFEVAPLAPQYRDFALWQQSWLKSAEADRQRQGWLADLDGLRPRAGTVAPYAADMLSFQLDARIAQRLSALCVKYRIKPFAAMLACYATLLFAETGERDLVVGTVRANRRRPDTAQMVGHFANLIPLRIRIDERESPQDLVRDTAAVCAAAHARDELPFLDLAGAVWRRLQVPASRLAEFTINFVPFPGEPVAWDHALRMEQIWGLFSERPLAISRATLFIRQQPSRLGGTLVYDPRTIDPASAAAFPERLAKAVTQLGDGSARSVADMLVAIASPDG